MNKIILKGEGLNDQKPYRNEKQDKILSHFLTKSISMRFSKKVNHNIDVILLLYKGKGTVYWIKKHIFFGKIYVVDFLY